MAKIVFNNVELEIIPIGHYYRSDGSDTNEFYYAISLYEDKKRQSYPLGINNGLIDVFEIETMDYMISQSCFDALYNHKVSYADDICNGGFDMSFSPIDDKWKIEIELNPYYLEHEYGIEYSFELSKDEFFLFSKTLRLEEIKVIVSRG